jgi:thioredoxin reductase (NADPH)
MAERFDCVIVGGGPAGLSAAIHLAWHKRSVVVLDRRTGPLFFTLTPLINVPGMPEKTGVQIQKELRQQALSLGAEVRPGDVTKVSGEAGEFHLETAKGEEFIARTLLLATGVARYHPTVDGDYKQCLAYAGKCNVFYCPDCEAPEIEGKSTLIIGVGRSRGAVGTARHLYDHNRDLRLLLTGEDDLRETDRAWLSERNLPIVYGEIGRFVGKRGCLEHLEMKDGTTQQAQAYFVASPKVPRTDLGEQLGLSLVPSGHLAVKSQRGDTAVEGVWVAGDLRPMTQQVSIALGTGNIAAVHIDQYLTSKYPV